MTDDLVAFLRARLDEDEQAALGTLDPLALIGRHRGKPEQRWKVTESGRGIIDADGNTLRAKDVFPAEAEHIVRHDPARVLAEVDAKRSIIAASPVACPPACARDHTFSGSCALRWMGPVVWGEDESRWVRDSDGATVLAPPVTTNYVLRLLALPYADHPDYRPEWAPVD